MGIPGVGPLVAITFKSAIDNPGRIVKSKRSARYLDWCPRNTNPGRGTLAGASLEPGTGQYEEGICAYKIKEQVAMMLAKKELKKAGNKAHDFKFEPGEKPEEPLPTRYRTNDSSYEAIGELLIANPTGILVERDELVLLLQHLDREDQAVARGFYLSAWQYPARPHRRIRPPLARLFLRFRHIRNVERFASFRQRDPRIPQARIVFAL
jgi:hypothetical protein